MIESLTVKHQRWQLFMSQGYTFTITSIKPAAFLSFLSQTRVSGSTTVSISEAGKKSWHRILTNKEAEEYLQRRAAAEAAMELYKRGGIPDGDPL